MCKYISRKIFHILRVTIWDAGMRHKTWSTLQSTCNFHLLASKNGIQPIRISFWILLCKFSLQNPHDARFYFSSLCLLIHDVPSFKKKKSHNWESINRNNTVCIKSCGPVTFNQESLFISKLFSALHLLHCFVVLHCQSRQQLWFDGRQRWICLS